MPRTIDIAEKIAQLRAFYKQEGRAPSYAEMAELFGYKSKNAAYKAANKLIEHNYLSRSKKGNLTFTPKITGGIAVYKSCTVVRRLIDAGHEVRVAMTSSATRFVTPMTFEVLSGQGVGTRFSFGNRCQSAGAAAC